MVVGPIRALLTAHVQASWNRSLKELGKGGTTAMVALLVVLLVVVLVPAMGGFGVLGYVIATGIEKPFAPMALALLLTAVGFGGGFVCGIAGGARALEWERYRAFPLGLRSLFAAELMAGAGDLLPLFMLLGMGFLSLGMALAHPGLIPLLPGLLVATAVILLTTQHLVGALAGALVKRLKVGLLILGILAWVLSAMAPTFLPSSRRSRSAPRATESKTAPRGLTNEQTARLESGLHTLDRVVACLPHGQAAKGLQDAVQGRWGRAFLRQLYLLAVAAALAFGAARTLVWETAPEAGRAAEKGVARKLWTFKTPVMGLGRLAWETLLGSHLGKFGFLIPLMTLVLLKGPFGQMKGQGAWAIPGAFAYLSLTGSQMLFNQFGLYQHGIKALLLLPVSSRQLLLGQMTGLGAYMAVQGLTLVMLLGFVSHPPPLELAAGLCLATCFFWVQAAVGHFTSVAMPRAMPRDSLKSGGMSLVLVLISLGTTLGSTLVFGGAYVLCAWLRRPWLLPVMLGLAGLCGLGYWLLLPLSSRFLQEKREKLVEALG